MTENSDVETAVTRWLKTQDTDWYDKCHSCGQDYAEKLAGLCHKRGVTHQRPVTCPSTTEPINAPSYYAWLSLANGLALKTKPTASRTCDAGRISGQRSVFAPFFSVSEPPGSIASCSNTATSRVQSQKPNVGHKYRSLYLWPGLNCTTSTRAQNLHCRSRPSAKRTRSPPPQ